MWRNIYYDARKQNMHLWGWDKNGKPHMFVEHFTPYIFIESQHHNDATSIFGTSLKRIDFKTLFDLRRYVNIECKTPRIFFNLRPEQQFLLEKFQGVNTERSILEHSLRIFFLDIEVYSPDKFPIPERASEPINLITIYDSQEDELITFGLDNDYTPSNPNHRYYKCNTESQLLKNYLQYWEDNFPDIVSGWNSQGFDIPYIVNRIKNLLGEEEAKRLSPVQSIWYRPATHAKYGKLIGRWHIHGISCIDYLEAYKSFSRSERESYSLDYIAKVELNEGKVQYNATNLAQLAKKDWQLFVDYNVQDVAILKKLEDKLRYLQIMRMITLKGFTTLESAMGKIAVISGAIANAALQKGLILPTFKHPEKGSYEGGFVKDITPGLREGIITFDANSLYPNTLISLNLSLETKIGKVISFNKDKDIVEIRLVNGKISELTTKQFEEFIRANNIAKSSAHVLYSQKKKGIIPEYVDSLYAERVAAKKEMLNIAERNQQLSKKSKEYQQNKQQEEQLDILQYTLKILLNSIYGVFANKGSPFFDLDHAASITNTGQAVIKAANNIANKYIQEKYEVDADNYVYSDTDSVDSNTLIQTNRGKIKIEQLFDMFAGQEKTISTHGHEILPVNNLQVLTYNEDNNKPIYQSVKNIIRHKVSKKKFKIKHRNGFVIVTEDHSCIVKREGKMIEISPKEINIHTDTLIVIQRNHQCHNKYLYEPTESNNMSDMQETI